MDEDNIKKLIEQSTDTAVSNMMADMGNVKQGIVEEIRAEIENALNSLTSKNELHETKITELTAKVSKLRAEITEEIRAELREELSETRKEQAIFSLQKEIKLPVISSFTAMMAT